MTIYLTMSLAQDECTLCNRWFRDYGKAWQHVQDTEKDSGCTLALFAVENGEDDAGQGIVRRAAGTELRNETTD